MSIKLYKSNWHEHRTEKLIWANSLALDWAFFIKNSSSFADKATTGTRIVWVNITETTLASDNQTVAKKEIVFMPSSIRNLYEVEITGWTITRADEWKYYNLTDADTVDWTTETTVESYVDTVAWTAIDPVVKMQVRLVEFVSATLGRFEIVL